MADFEREKLAAAAAVTAELLSKSSDENSQKDGDAQGSGEDGELWSGVSLF